MMRNKTFMTLVVIMITSMALAGCSSDDNNRREASPYPQNRIIGSWKLVKVNDVDKSSENIVYTFIEDGTWTVSGLTPSEGTASEEGVSRLVSFEDGWSYDKVNDVITGYLDLASPSFPSRFPYRFELKREELMLSFEPRGMVYILPPTPDVRYFVRGN